MAESVADIFIIKSLKKSPGEITAIVAVNTSSPIFEGHFPGQPVTPGACMVQLVKDVLCIALDIHIILKRAAHIKFINIIPAASHQLPTLYLAYKLNDGMDIGVTAKITIDNVAYFKLQATYATL